MVKSAYPLAQTPILTPQQWSNLAKNLLGTGVIKGQLNELLVYADSTGMQCKVKTGQAWVQGHFFQSDTEVVLPIAAANASNPRIDRVILRIDWAADTMDLAVLQGTPAVSPVEPSLTQIVGTRWEIPLCNVWVAANVSTIAAVNITDERVKVKNTNDLSTPWYDLVLQNGWVNFGSGFANAQYRLNEIGKLELRGRIKSGSVTIGVTLATLPAGFRPLYGAAFSVNTNNGSGLTLGEVDVQTGGNIILATGANGYVSLDVITVPLN